ncbi:MAG: hypothetical protein AMXMBFR53_29120 [Gemmatimonadota bacterium]
MASYRRSAPVLAVLLALIPAPALAQQGGSNGRARPFPSVRAERLAEVIHMDGVLDEAAWAQATPVTEFIQLDPFEGQPVSERTEVRVLYDDDAIYVGAVLYDRSPVSTRLGRRDGFLMDSDQFVISFDSYNDNRTGFKFEINPSGVRGDQALSGGQDRRGDSSWDPVWEAATHVGDEGWSLEARIPLSQLRFRNAEEQSWGVQFTREIARNRENAVFSFTPKNERSGIARFGDLVGLQGIRQSRGLELLPYFLGRADFVTVAQDDEVSFKDPFRDGSDIFYGAGLNLKYRLSSSLTLNATANPDFGQVEVDPATVNLTAYETRYQEKRPFFVEGADVFSFGGGGGGGGGEGMFGGGGMGGGGDGGGGGGAQILYSRRIGAAPRGGLPDEAVYGDAPEAATILGAAKLTGKTAGGWSLGIMEAVTQREIAAYADDANQHHEAEVEPLTSYLVARARRDSREGQTNIGVIATAVNRELGDAAMASALRSSAYVGGVDFLHEFADRTWSLNGHFVASRIAGDPTVMISAQRSSARYYQRPDADYVSVDSAAATLLGYRASLELQKQAGLHWQGGVELGATSPGFEVNDLGYQRDADRRSASVRLEYSENRPGTVLRRWNVNAGTDATWNFGNDRLATGMNVRGNWTFMNYWSVNLGLTHDFAALDDRLTRGGPLARTLAGNQLSFGGSSDFSRPYTFRGNGRFQWDEAGGRQVSFGGSVGMKPSSTWELSLGPRISVNEAAAQYVTRVEDATASSTHGRRYVFADLKQTTLSIDTRLNLTFTPDLTLEIYAQPFLASGDYGALKELRAPRSFDFDRYGLDRGSISVDAEGDYLIDPDGTGPAAAFTVSDRDFSRVSLRGTGVLRWEWRPGSTLFLVWQQSRADELDGGRFEFGRGSRAMFGADADNVFMLKATYWIGS